MLYDPAIRKYPHIGMFLRQLLQCSTPQTLQLLFAFRIRQHSQFHRPQICIGDIEHTMLRQTAFQRLKPVSDPLFCCLRIIVMFQQFCQIHDQKGNVRLKRMIGGSRVQQSSQFISIAFRIVDFRLFL